MNRVENASLEVMREHAVKLRFNMYSHSEGCLEINGANALPPTSQQELVDAVRVLARGHVQVNHEGNKIIVYPLDQYGAGQEAANLSDMATRLADAGINYPGSEEYKTRTPD